MEGRGYQIAGLVGFIIAGLIFIVVGVRADDFLTVTGSVVWTISCIIWMIPLIKTMR